MRDGLLLINSPSNWVRDNSYQELLLLDDKGLVKNKSLLARIDQYYGTTVPSLFNWTNYDVDLVLSAQKLIEFNDRIKLYPAHLPVDIDSNVYKAELVQFIESARVHNIIQFDYHRKKILIGELNGAISKSLELKSLIEQELEVDPH